MNLITLLIFAIGLCFDSFAVSVSCGMLRCAWKTSLAFRFALILGVMQALMPLIGWGLAANFHSVIESYDHWVAFVLLLILGGKMIWGALKSDKNQDDQQNQGNPFALRRAMVLGVATSIDALIAGVAMACLRLDIIPQASQLSNMMAAIFVIGLITFIASMIGLLIGRSAQGKIGEKAELIGGVILILIGTKVLWEHLLT